MILSDDAAINFPTGLGNTNTLDSWPGLGTLSFLGTVGVFDVNVTTGVSKPEIGPDRLVLNSINVSSGAGSLKILLIDTEYTGSYPSYLAEWGGTTDNTVGFKFFHDENDNEPPALVSTFSSPTEGPGDFSGDGTFGIVPSGSYSLAIEATVVHTEENQETSFNAKLTPVPVPPAVWLFASGLLGLVGIARRKAV